MEFDASIDLTTELVAAHIPPLAAVEMVRTALESLPGAFWISVEWCGRCPDVEWVRVYRRGQGGTMQGEPWDTIKTKIKTTAVSALVRDLS